MTRENNLYECEKMNSYLFFSKLQKSSFMYVTYCKLCPLSSIITENVPDVCKPLQVMSFSPNSVNFCG
ncbi:hypothetical protein Hanom_Chr17g01531921 [Helianthus anomalus]